MPPRKPATCTRAAKPAPTENTFAQNTSAFVNYSESISALGNSHRCITAFGPSTSAAVPPTLTMDTDSGNQEYIISTVIGKDGNKILIRSPVAD